MDIDRMRVASPCHVGWDSMTGNDRARFCGSCDRHVYNIIGLSRPEIESLVENTEGRLCVRMYQRADATVLSEDCPVGLRLIRKRIATFAGAAFSALLGLVSIGYGQNGRDSSRSNITVDRVKPVDSCFYSETKVVERTKADSKKGQISGQIFDPMGAVVPGIKLKLQLEKRVVSSVTSDATGLFVFPEIKPAENYTLRIDGQHGWKKQLVEGIAVNAGEKISYIVCIQVDNVYEVVGLFFDPVEVLLTEATKPTETFVPRKTYRLPPTPKKTPSKP